VERGIATQHAADDRLHRSGGRCPPLPASGDPRGPAVRGVAAGEGGAPPEKGGAAKTVGSVSSTLLWWRCVDILRLSPGCDGRARVESGECRCPIQASDMQRHAAWNAV